MKKSLTIFLTWALALLLWSCKKDYSEEGGGSIKATGNWSFNEGLSLYNGNIDTSFIQISSGTRVLHLQGPSISGDEVIFVDLYSAENFKPGSYKASASQASFSYATKSKQIYQSDILAGEFIVNINDIGNNSLSGDFSGIVVDSTGASKNISNGKFTSTINLANNTTNNNSDGTLGSTQGSCTQVTPTGTYMQNIPLTNNNTIQIQVNVTTPGIFTINTNSVNGVSFSKSGNFVSTGVQTVTLDGTGTPQSSGIKSYILTYGSSSCNFDLTFN